MKESNHNLEDSYHEQLEPAVALQKSLALMDGAYKHAVLGLLHDPANPLAKQQDHPLTRHSNSITNKIKELIEERKFIQQHPLEAEKKFLLDDFIVASDTLIRESLQPAKLRSQRASMICSTILCRNHYFHNMRGPKPKLTF